MEKRSGIVYFAAKMVSIIKFRQYTKIKDQSEKNDCTALRYSRTSTQNKGNASATLDYKLFKAGR